MAPAVMRSGRISLIWQQEKGFSLLEEYDSIYGMSVFSFKAQVTELQTFMTIFVNDGSRGNSFICAHAART